MSETLDFLELILPPEGDHWYVAAIFRDNRVTHRWHTSRLNLASCLIEEDRNGATVYFASGVYRSRSEGRKSLNSAGANSLWTDIDAGEGKQYATADEAHNALVVFCDAERLPRPLCVGSGFGIHAYWPLLAPVDPETWKRYAAGLAALLRKHGIKHERTTDLASLLRPPGTHNRKRATPVEVSIMDQPGDLPYELAQLEGLLDARPPTAAAGIINGHSVAGRLAVIGTENRYRRSRDAFDGCKQLSEPARDGRGLVPQPLWYAGLGVFAYCDDGDEFGHEWSQDDDRYTEAETGRKLDQARINTTGATTCAYFHEINPQTCEACPHWGKIKSPIALCTKAEKEKDRVAGSENEGIILPSLPESYGWNRNKSLCLLHEDNNGKQVETVISEHTVYLLDVHGREARVMETTIVFKQYTPRSGWRDIIIPANTLFSAEGRAEMARQGAFISDWPAFVKYTIAAANMKVRSGEIETLYEQHGWKNDDTGFLYGTQLFSPTGVTTAFVSKDLKDRAGGKEVWVGPSRGGSLTEWSTIANKLFAAGTEAQSVCLCASFGAVLHRFLSRDEGGSVVSLVTHTGGRGKTTALAGALSIWGRKEGLSIQNIDTPISRGAVLSMAGNLPVFYDEFETCDPVYVRDFIRMFTNGKDKRRMGRDGSMKDQGLPWQTCLFTASNASLVDSIASSGNDVLSSRIWEMSMNIPEHLRGLYAGDTLKDALRNHSGHAGHAFISKLMQPGNVAAARHALEHWYLRIEKSGTFTTEHRFWLRLAATVAVAAEIVTNGERILSFDADRIRTWLIEQMRQRVGFIKTEDWAFDALGEFINASQSHAVVVDGPFVPGQVGATVYVKPTRELYIRGERNGRKIYIDRSALRDWCVKRGMNMREFIDDLTRDGVCLAAQKYVTLGAGTDFPSMRVHCLEIDGRHEKVAGLFTDTAGDVLPFKPRVDPNYDDSLGGVSDDVPF